MGGIKNKLSKLSNKVKTLLSSLSLKGAVSRRLTEGSPKLGSRLSSFSQPSKMPDGQISNTRKLSHWGLYAEKTIGSLRPTTLTKYLSLACFSIAILSTLVLNILSSYSNSQILSNAEPVGEVSTSANDSSTCNPTNTNAPSCISLSITSSSSTSTGGDDANLSLQIPREGGIATGRHTVTVNSNNYTGYYVTLTGNAGSPAMTPTTSTSQAFIQSTTGTLTNPSPIDKGQWGSWGIALPNSSLYTGFNTNEMDYSSTDQDVLHKTTWAAVPGKEADDASKIIIKTTTSSKKTDTYPVYYGVRVTNPASTPADTYTAQVVYTATTNEVPTPTVDTLSKNSYELGSGASGQITISGTNLGSTYDVYLTNTNGDRVGECANLNVIDGGSISCTAPTTDITAGSYTLHVVTQGGEATTLFTYTESKIKSSYVDYGEGIGHVQVDYDANMIPVTYTGNETTPKWVIADTSNTNSDTNLNWYDYPNKKWANAVTLTEEGLSLYKGKPVGTAIDEQYVLGYWVYIPRYAYKVMRKEVTNRVVTDTVAISRGGFDIRFETNEDVVKTPSTKCDNSTQDYWTCLGSNALHYPGNSEALKGQTAWATHPAFTWKYTQEINGFDKTYELNGIWVGKFEVTGSSTSPTVLPNQIHIGEADGGIGDYYDISQSVGAEDANNTYGNSTQTSYNNGRGYHNLTISTSHMLKNSEWGSMIYLASSVYGVGLRSNAVAANNSDRYTGRGSDGTSQYYSSLGRAASTTNTVYGVYDTVGGGDELVMGGYTTSAIESATTYMSTPVRPPYINLYSSNVFTDDFFTNGSYLNNNHCTWTTCGGHGLYETKNVQNVADGNINATWFEERSLFPDNFNEYSMRGGYPGGEGDEGLFYATAALGSDGNGYEYTFRAALIVLE